ncbi:MAG: dialkylresorcinol condensing enzyme [Sulfurovum sp.]|nr:dialkylresorcinol condensing enzyme [Sulfurovum sp.]
MKKVLVLYYSQTGQLTNVLKSFTSALDTDENIEVIYHNIEPAKEYPFPWGYLEFFDIFPESVYMDGCALKKCDNITLDDHYDLVILAYTIWFLSPSLPISGFLNSRYSKVLKDKPVITLIACRNMWIMAQEKMKDKLNNVGAKLIDNVVLIDQGGNLATFITTPRWMWTGRKNAFWGLPKAGVNPNDIKDAQRFGKVLTEALAKDEEKKNTSLLYGLKAVQVDNRLIGTEKIAHKSFKIWGGLIRKFGKTGDKARIPMLFLYFIFLLSLIVIVVPINTLIKPLLRKLNSKTVDKERAYFEEPSGSGNERMKDYSNA